MRIYSLLIFLSASAAFFLQGAIDADGKKIPAKGLSSINRNTAEAVVGFLSDDCLCGREAGTPDSRVAACFLASMLKDAGIAPMYGGFFQEFQIKKDTACVMMQNVLGIIPGRNPDEYVVVGAHYDHLGTDLALEGDRIYNGADDNASGVSAVMQIARAFVAEGKRPMRNVVIAFWDGEEKGLLGSRHFMDNFCCPERVAGYVNFDMIGRNSNPDRPMQVTYFYTAAFPEFGEWLRNDIRKYGLELDPDYNAWDNPVGGSDNASFALKGIPIIWYHTGGHPDYHKPGDHADKLNWDKVIEITKASFLNAWNLANMDLKRR